MNILHTITSMDPKLGGVSQAVRTIASSLNALGVTNEVVCLDASDSNFLKHDKIRIHAIGAAKGPWAHNPSLAPWLRQNLKNYDVVISHGLWQYQSHATSNAVARSKKTIAAPKFYVMPHGMLDPYFQKAASRRLKAIRNYAYWALIENNVINSADGLLFTCEEEKQLARVPFKPYKPNRELVVGLGVDEPPAQGEVSSASFQRLGHREQSYLLFMSRLHEKKGADLLIPALEEVSRASHCSQSLIVAGPGLETGYGSSLRTMASQQELTKDKITFAGMISGDFKWSTLYNCSAFVLPSHQENFGIAVVEALACGRPVLISNKVNIWREIEEGKCGFIADDTLEGTVSMLKKWNSLSETEKKDMGKRARTLYETKFAVPQAASRFLNAIKE